MTLVEAFKMFCKRSDVGGNVVVYERGEESIIFTFSAKRQTVCATSYGNHEELATMLTLQEWQAVAEVGVEELKAWEVRQ